MLNPSQQLAVEYRQGHLLIIAGPGTGKTHTLTHRIAHFLGDLTADQKILAITFTNKAAGEMQERMARLASSGAGQTFIGTFHQFCLYLLREHDIFGKSLDCHDTRRGPFRHYQHTGKELLRVASPEEIEILAKEIWPAFSARQRRLKLQEISQWKSLYFDEAVPEDVFLQRQALQDKGWLDFDDLLLDACHLLRENSDIRQITREKFPFIFVDEYQDINRIQNELLKLLVGPQNVITAIGDPNQAIYGFRGSSLNFFESFDKDFPGAKIFSLSENYRNAPNLLSASSQVMAKSGSFHVPELTARIYAQGRLAIYEASTDKAEAEYVVHQIEKLVGGVSMFSRDSGRLETGEEGGYTFGDIAVLYRLNHQRRELKKAFERLGIPYSVSGECGTDEEDPAEDIYFSGTTEPLLAAEKVSLMTLHAAKGLEFPVVLIVGCEETLLPLDMEGMRGDPQEERRLFYVGMTRAKERLFLCRAQRRLLYGKTYTNAASRFLTDIAENLKEYERQQIRKRAPKEESQIKLFDG